MPKGRRVRAASLCKILLRLHPALSQMARVLPHLHPSFCPVPLPSPVGYWLRPDRPAAMLVLPRNSASSLPATWSAFNPSTKLVWNVCCESGLVASTGRPTQPLASENVHFLEGRPPLFCLVLTWAALTSRGWAQVPTVHQLAPLPLHLHSVQ